MANSADGTDGKLSAAERAALKQRVTELREQAKPAKGEAKRRRDADACDAAIAALTGTDQAIAQLLHRVVADEAPQLDAKTWYGFPSYARDGDVIVFFQPASKFDARYGTVGFNGGARLDDGPMWATGFAVTDVTGDVEKRLRDLVRRAAG